MSVDVNKWMDEVYYRMQLKEAVNNFLLHYSEVSEKKATHYYNKYWKAVSKEIHRQLMFPDNTLLFPFDATRVSDECNYFRDPLTKRSISIYDTFKQAGELITIVRTGIRNKSLSMIRVNDDRYLNLLISTADAKEVINFWFKGVENAQRIYVEVDTVSLKHYITDTKLRLNQLNPNNEYQKKLWKKLNRNYIDAQLILLVAQYMADSGECSVPSWPHVAKPSPYGRNYHYGLSLMSCSKEVRRAAIGDHYQYDLNAAVYAVKLTLLESLAKQYGSDISGLFTNIKEYVDHKNGIRNRLAQHIQAYQQPIKLVKKAMTSFGFGASTSDGAWKTNDRWQQTTMRSIFWNDADRQRFTRDEFVKQFVKEQSQLNEVLTEYYKLDEDFMNAAKTAPGVVRQDGSISNNNLIAYVYQQHETVIMREITNDIQPVFMLHDAFITKQRLSREQLRNIKLKLREYGQFMSIEEEHIEGYRNWKYDDDVIEHKQRMEEQQQLAQQKYGKLSEHNTVKRIDYERPETEFYSGDGSWVKRPYDRDLDPFYDTE